MNEVGASYPLINLVDQGIRTAFENSGYKLELYREYFDTVLFPDPADRQMFGDFYIRKYRNRMPDVIITVGPTPLRFMIDVHSKYFPGVPIVYCLPSDTPSNLVLDSWFTGVAGGEAGYAPTVAAALGLKPDTKLMVVVGGIAVYDRKQQAAAKDQLRVFHDQLNVLYLTELDTPTLLQRLKHLPSHTIVLMTALGKDTAGATFTSAEAGPMVVNAANAPVFSVSDRFFNHGEVGGNMSSGREQGRIAGTMALRLLRGEKAQSIPAVNSANAYMFDWRALKRWGLKERNLPPGSLVLNRQPTVWEAYKGYIIAACSLILLETALIYGLVWQIKRRRKAETELAMTYDRLRLAVDAGKAVGWEWDVKTERDRWFGDLKNMFGIPSDSFSGTVADFRRRVHPEDQAAVSQAVADSRKYREPYAAEFRVIRADGRVHWVTARGKFYYNANGEAERMLGMAVDITERKTAEESLSNLSGRLIAAQEEERRRIAREIHDDYNQRLAMLAIDLEELKENCSIDTGARLHELWNQVSELGADLHSLSHRLHSSTLERLGLVAGVRAFCQEFSEQQGIHISFVHDNLPPNIPEDGALCLFRIAQEALRNVKRHSGADRAIVRLEVTGQKLHLAVEDQGNGFELPRQGAEAGIGIRSMEERLRILGGKFEIHSRPKEGTRIDAWLPFQQPASRRAS